MTPYRLTRWGWNMATRDLGPIRKRVAAHRWHLTRYQCVGCARFGRTSLIFGRTKYKTCLWCQERLAITWTAEHVTVMSVEDALAYLKYQGGHDER